MRLQLDATGPTFVLNRLDVSKLNSGEVLSFENKTERLVGNVRLINFKPNVFVYPNGCIGPIDSFHDEGFFLYRSPEHGADIFDFMGNRRELRYLLLVDRSYFISKINSFGSKDYDILFGGRTDRADRIHVNYDNVNIKSSL